MRSLVGTGTAEDYEHGLRKNREISSDGPILDVRNVQILALLLRKIRTTGNLPRTSNTGLHQQTRGIQGAIAGNLVRQRRTRPNQRHIALQHVKELRELIQRSLTNKMANLRNTWIILHFEDKTIALAILFRKLLLQLFCIGNHGTELVHGERLTM